MAEYIDRDAAIAEEEYDGNFMLVVPVKKIRNIPAADVAPVRHGRWEWCKDYYGDSILVCSECGRVCHEEDAPYCYCGCKMDLKEEQHELRRDL